MTPPEAEIKAMKAYPGPGRPSILFPKNWTAARQAATGAAFRLSPLNFKQPLLSGKLPDISGGGLSINPQFAIQHDYQNRGIKRFARSRSVTIEKLKAGAREAMA